MKYNKRRFKKDLIFLLSIALALYLAKSPHILNIVESSTVFVPLTIFIAGLLFTSFLTTPIAIVTLYALGQNHHPLYIALIGALGSALGDLVLIKLLRNFASKEMPLVFLGSQMIGDFAHLFPKKVTEIPLKFVSREKRIFIRLLRLGFMRSWVLPVLGAMIIASPFPDEAGIILLGASAIDYRKVFVLSYLLSVIGIFLVAGSAKLI